MSIHHELNGGRYLGTACGVIMRDPDTNIQAYDANVAELTSMFGEHLC